MNDTEGKKTENDSVSTEKKPSTQLRRDQVLGSCRTEPVTSVV